MEFFIDAVINMDPERGISFSVPLEYSNSDDVSVSISDNSEDKSKLNAKFKVRAESLEQAKFVTENELLKVANILSWEKAVPVKGFSINSSQYSSKEGNRNTVMFAKSITIDTYVSAFTTLKGDSVKKLATRFESYDSTAEDIMMMWREALSEDSESMKFLLYFRILEYIHGGKRIGADNYIRTKIPSVEIRKSGKGNNENVSVYTYLRDNIHAKNSSFPYKEIRKYLSSLNSLTREAIKEKHNI